MSELAETKVATDVNVLSAQAAGDSLEKINLAKFSLAVQHANQGRSEVDPNSCITLTCVDYGSTKNSDEN